MIYFLDPDTGETYPVAETKAAVDAAWKLGFLPKTEQDFDAVERVERSARAVPPSTSKEDAG